MIGKSEVINALRSIASTTSCETERSLKEGVAILQHSDNLLLVERGERKASVFPSKYKESTICFQNKLLEINLASSYNRTGNSYLLLVMLTTKRYKNTVHMLRN